MKLRKSILSLCLAAKSKYGDFSVLGLGCEIRMVLTFLPMVLPLPGADEDRGREDFEGAKIDDCQNPLSAEGLEAK